MSAKSPEAIPPRIAFEGEFTSKEIDIIQDAMENFQVLCERLASKALKDAAGSGFNPQPEAANELANFFTAKAFATKALIERLPPRTSDVTDEPPITSAE